MLQSASCFQSTARKCLCQRRVTSVTYRKNESFGARGRYLKFTLFKRNATQDFICARGRYLLPTTMDKQYQRQVSQSGLKGKCITREIPASGTKSDAYFWDAFSKRYNEISKCRSDTCFSQTQDVICLNDQTPMSHFAQNLRYLLLAQRSSFIFPSNRREVIP